MRHKTPSWTLEDLIDLEYFLFRDETRPDNTEQHRHERTFYLETIRPMIPEPSETNHESDSFVIRHWLSFRRKSEKDARPHELVLPGDIFRQIYTVLITIFLILGFGSGWGLSFSFLIYKGTAPLNVSSYLGLFVFSQMALILLVIGYLLFSRLTVRPPSLSLIRLGVSTLLIRLALWVKKRSERHISSEKRRDFKAALGVIHGKSRNYTALFPWPVFILTQVFAVFFNLGVLTATLLRVIGSDLAFGWQSTLQLSGSAVYKATVLLSLPWSWAIPPHLAHPTISQIEGSRIVLKDGIMRLATQDLTAWWPFLCFAVLCYGLAPRILFLTGALVLEKRALKRVRFQSIAFDRLLLRLRSPMLDTRGESQTGRATAESPDESSRPPEIEPLGGPVIALVPEDIYDACPDQDLKKHLEAVFSSPFHKKASISLSINHDRAMLKSLMNEPESQMVLLMESWQPPIREIIEYIRNIRTMGGRSFRLHILLIGTPTARSIFTKPEDHDITVWKQGITALGDPYINLVSLQ